MNSQQITRISHNIDKQNYIVIEDEGKTYSKRILQSGIDESQPGLGSKAKVKICFFGNFTPKEHDLGEYKSGVDVSVTIGEGDSELSQLIDRVVQTMRKEEWCYVKTKIELYEGCDNKGDTQFTVSNVDKIYTGINFSIRLQSFTSAPDFNQVEPMQKIEMAEHHKTKGIEHFKAERFDQSCKRFEKALDYLTSLDLHAHSSNISVITNRLLCLCYMNLALVYMKKEQYEKALTYCNEALVLEPDNVKGLYRRAQTFLKLDRCKEARRDLVCAHEKDPSNSAITNSLKQVEKMLEKEMNFYKKMFVA